MARVLKYWVHAPDIPKQIGVINRYLRSSDLDLKLQHLVLLRVSQINKCAYCVDLHSREALRDGEDIQRLNCLCVWRECDFFSEPEKAALDWAEALTELSDERAIEAGHEAASAYFGAKDLSDLTFLIATMNAWNRMGVGLGRSPEKQ